MNEHIEGKAVFEKYIFILNPTAGKHRALDLREKISDKFFSMGISDKCEFILTERPMHACEAARGMAEKYGSKAVIYACGGDGTINEVLNGIIGSEAVLSVIPAGTGNDFIKSVFRVQSADEIIENILELKVKRIDAARIDDRYFVNVSSLGFDTVVGDRAKQMVAKFKFLGGSSYLFAVFACLFGKNYTRVKYELNCIDAAGAKYDIKERKEFVLAALANGEYYGGMFHPCPDADTADGLLDICIVDRISIPKILAMVPRYIKGSHIRRREVHSYKVLKGRIEGDGEKLLVNCDGESFERDAIEFAIVPDCVDLAFY